MTTEQAWTILKGCTLPEAFSLFGRNQEQIDKDMAYIKKMDSAGGGCSHYFSWAFLMSTEAYNILVKSGEIDSTKIFGNDIPL